MASKIVVTHFESDWARDLLGAPLKRVAMTRVKMDELLKKLTPAANNLLDKAAKALGKEE